MLIAFIVGVILGYIMFIFFEKGKTEKMYSTDDLIAKLIGRIIGLALYVFVLVLISVTREELFWFLMFTIGSDISYDLLDFKQRMENEKK